MNERICELIEQVVTRFDKDMDGSMEPEESGEWVRFECLEELIDVIVRECAIIAKNKQYKHSPAHSVGDCAAAIREHFGVK